MLKPLDQNLPKTIEEPTCSSSEMNLLLLLGSAVLTVLAVRPHYSAGQSAGVLLTLSAADQKELLDKHNALRKAVQPTASGMKQLFWNDQAAANAAYWAQQCTLAHSALEKRTLSTSQCGENIFKGNYPYAMSVAVQYWYDEVQYFDYGKGPTTKDKQWKHYTQVVWDSTSYLGCGKAECGADIWTVCHYCSAGNIDSKMATPYISGPPCSKCPNNCVDRLCTNPCIYEDLDPKCETYKPYCNSDPNVQKGCKATCRCS